MKTLILSAAFSLAAGVAMAEERIAALDFGLAMNSFLGRSVTVEGCQFVQATLTSVLCRIEVNKNMVGNFWIDAKEMDRETLKKVIIECGGLMSIPACKGNVTGTLETVFGDKRMMKATLQLEK